MADDSIGDGTVRHLASNQKYIARIRAAWPAFAARRQERLRQGGLFGPAVERIAENILEDLFVSVLDWPVANVNPQVDFADIVLTRLGLKWLVVEAKRPGALIGHRTAIEGALAQARRYAADQRVKTVAVSDAIMLYAADVVGGGLRSRVWLSLDTQRAPEDLWWLSVHGIYRPCPDLVDIPEAHVGDVMVRLGIAAKMLGKMPRQNASAAYAYLEAHRSLQQLDRLPDVGCCVSQ
ncbi:hypothetical protein MSP7336_01726 [Mycobacterium shimoidei]|uniref:Type I restriction enzyme R protein N-terminal domain-containing protein n=1 Tax=Mycobacterium shimoidei TaxID=29313 RepID=A0A375YX75_MYCSH|nr:hypothetical protein MSP7336_01726 [Mycobacterium shimoidei]